MKKYVYPKIVINSFSSEAVVTESSYDAMQTWKQTHADAEVKMIKMSELIQFTS